MSSTTPADFMATWIRQTNYPGVNVVLGSNPAGTVSRVSFVQKRFLMTQDVIPGIDFPSPFGFVIMLETLENLDNICLFFFLRYRWQIYLKCRAGGTLPDQHTTGEIREFNFFLHDESGFIDLDRRYTWVKCNNDFRGYYILDYSEELFAALNQVLTVIGLSSH